MYIKDWMTTDPIVVSPDTPIMEAQKIMRENRIRRLPVVERGELMGIVTYRDLIEASPSEATSLSIHELNYLLSKLKVKEVMTKGLVVVEPDETVEEAALRGTEKGVGALPVVHKGKLIGIATVADLFRTVMTLLGAREDVRRITLEDVDVQRGTLLEICRIVEGAGGMMVSIFSIPQKASDLRMVVIRAKDIGRQALEESLRNKGFTIHR
jgi:acetoin utilization protein AcuB